MEFLITESQLKLILQEQDQSKMSDYMKEMYSYTKNLVDKSKKIYGLNLKLLLTWGASIGGFVLPLDNFIKTGRFELNDVEQTLILIGIACSIFYDNSRTLKLIYKKIKEHGLEDVFKEVLVKSKNLKSSFSRFLSSANVTVSSSLDLLAYSFLIPIITDILDASVNGGDIEIMSKTIAKRLIASGVVIVSQVFLSETIKKLIKKFSRQT
jgi:hypothetical protein|tara:strand:+ start:186 stop:815 length:630 start_codon:yes stop_codon:yes gene_type:complete